MHFEGDAITDVTFLNSLTEGITVYYSAEKNGWEKVVAENTYINWATENVNGSIIGSVKSFNPWENSKEAAVTICLL